MSWLSRRGPTAWLAARLDELCMGLGKLTILAMVLFEKFGGYNLYRRTALPIASAPC